MEVQSGMLLHQLMRAHHNACTASLGRRGLRDVCSPRLLLELFHWPDASEQAPTQKELADRLHCAPPTIAASLKVLERQGYVERRTDEKDSRRNRISITRKGREAICTAMDEFRKVDEHMYHGFSPEERAMVYGFHRRMLENLYQIGGDRDDPQAPPPPGPPEPLERKCDPC